MSFACQSPAHSVDSLAYVWVVSKHHAIIAVKSIRAYIDPFISTYRTTDLRMNRACIGTSKPSRHLAHQRKVDWSNADSKARMSTTVLESHLKVVEEQVALGGDAGIQWCVGLTYRARR